MKDNLTTLLAAALDSLWSGNELGRTIELLAELQRACKDAYGAGGTWQPDLLAAIAAVPGLAEAVGPPQEAQEPEDGPEGPRSPEAGVLEAVERAGAAAVLRMEQLARLARASGYSTDELHTLFDRASERVRAEEAAEREQAAERELEQLGLEPGRWSARCSCRGDHASSSGRCTVRNVTDPTAHGPEDAVYCERCRESCEWCRSTIEARRGRRGQP